MKDLFQYHQNFLDPLVRSPKLTNFLDGLRNDVKQATDLSDIKTGPKRPSVVSVLLTEEPDKFSYLSFPLPIYRSILKLMELINEHLKISLNSCVVNHYLPSSSLKKPHSDNEPYIDQSTPICTFSIGPPRTLSVYGKSLGTPVLLEQTLEDASLHVMLPGSQEKTLHHIQAGAEERWSISFRKIHDTPFNPSIWPYLSCVHKGVKVFSSPIFPENIPPPSPKTPTVNNESEQDTSLFQTPDAPQTSERIDPYTAILELIDNLCDKDCKSTFQMYSMRFLSLT